jgi:UDP-2,3-diacylglucosamine hydrolase
MQTLFISDLHLSDERPDKINLFKRLLRGPALDAEALYILGDLFEAWAGDDDITPPHPEVIAELSEFTLAGGRLYLMRGNRDYLMGEQFAHKTGGQLIADPTLIDLYGTKTLIMHGDTLCTSDIKYQVFRRIINNRFSIGQFLLLPYSLRQKIWHGIRNITRKTTVRKPHYIIDVSQSAVEKVMIKYDVLTLIHGHTHHEAVHEFELNGYTAQRYVLSDWYKKDGVLIADNSGLRMMRVEEYLQQS